MKMKRFTALFIAMTMLLGLVPVTAAEGPAQRPYKHTLTYNITPDVLSDRVPVSSIRDLKADQIYLDGTTELVDNVGLLNWKYTSSNVAEGDTGEVPYKTLDTTKTAPYAVELDKTYAVTGDGSAHVKAYGLKSTMYNNKREDTSGNRSQVVLRLYIDYPGEYSLVPEDITAVSGKKTFSELYFGKAQATYNQVTLDALLPTYQRLGWWNADEGCWSTDVTSAKEQKHKLDSFKINVEEAGEYYLVFDMNAKSLELNSTSYGTYQDFYLRSVTLTAIELEPESLETSLGKSEINGRTIDVTAKIKMTDGNYKSFSSTEDADNTVVVTASNNITVSDVVYGTGDTISFKITPNATGDGKITVSGKSLGRDYSFSQDVTIVPEPAQRPYKHTVVYNLTTDALSDRVPVTTVRDATKDQIWLDGTKEIAEKLELFNWKYTTSNVVEGDTGEVPYKTLDTAKTAPYAVELGRYGVTGDGSTRVMPNGLLSTMYNSRREDTSGERSQLVLRLYIDFPGEYTLLPGDITDASGKKAFAELYFGKAQDKYDQKTLDTLLPSYQCLGWWNGDEGCWSDDVTVNKEQKHKLDNFKINVEEAGEYYLVFDMGKKSLELNPTSYGTYQDFYLRTVTLTAIELEPTSLETSLKTAEINGKAVDVTAKIKMTDGTYKSFSSTEDADNTAVVTASDNITVTDVVYGTGDTITFKITPNAAGIGTVTVSGKSAGHEYSFSQDVMIVEDGIPYQEIDFLKYYTLNPAKAVFALDYAKEYWAANREGTTDEELTKDFWATPGRSFYNWGLLAYLSVGKSFAIDFEIFRDGYYDVSMQIGANGSRSGQAGVWIDGQYVGQTEKGANKILQFRPIELKAGRHTLFVRGDIAGDTPGYAGISPAKLIFTGREDVPPELTDVELTLDADSGYAGQEISMTVELVFDGGIRVGGNSKTLSEDLGVLNKFKTAEDESFLFTSSDETVAKIEGSGIKLLKKGSSVITYKAKIGDAEITKTVTVTVGEPILRSIRLKTEKSYILLSDEDGMKINVSGTMSDDSDAVFPEGSITYKSSDNSIATVSADGIIKANKAGDFTVEVSVKFGEMAEAIVETVSLTASEKPIPAEFEIYFNEKAVWDQVNKDGNLTKDTVGTTWRIDTDVTPSIFWDGTAVTARILTTYYDYLYLSTYYGDFSVKFNVPETRIYDITAQAMLEPNNGPAKFYIDGKYIGEFDTRAPVADFTTVVEKKLRSIKLDEGEHRLTIDHPGNRLLIRGFRFTGIDDAEVAIKSINVEVTDKVMAPGEEGDYRVSVTQESGAHYYMPLINYDGTTETDFTVTSATPEIVSASEGVYKALKPGDGILRTEGILDGKERTGEGKIDVKDITFDKVDVNLYEDALYFVGGEKTLSTSVILSDGSVTDARNVSNVRYELAPGTTAAKIENDVFKALAEDTVEITAYATFNGVEKSVTKNIKIENIKLAAIEARSEDNVVSVLDEDGSRILVTGILNNGEKANLDGETTIFSYESLDPDIVKAENGYAHYVSRGVGTVRVTASNEAEGWSFSCDTEITSSSQKKGPTIYTQEMRDAALKNAQNFQWAKDTVKAATAAADNWVENLDKLYDVIPTEGFPRCFGMATLGAPTIEVNGKKQPMDQTCPYCGVNILMEHGYYSWIVDPIKDPWKIACPGCKRKFPTNDFGSFYKLGINEDGVFDRELALKKHRELFADDYARTGSDYGYGYLKNDLYSEHDATWMVDDGFGWSPRDGVPGSRESVKTNPKYTPLAFYHHKVWDMVGADKSIFTKAVRDLYEAYLYTGEKKYGVAGVILLDRIADVYPAYDLTKVSLSYGNSHGGDYTGKTVGNIWETYLAEVFARAYDALYPAMAEPEVIEYLSEKAKTLKGVTNPKTSADHIRENIENGIIREGMKGIEKAQIFGNFGMHQLPATLFAVALDNRPETNEMFNWLIQPYGEVITPKVDPIYNATYNVMTENHGGEMFTRYINRVDRDGFGDEVGIGYNMLWVTYGLDVAELIYRTGAETELNLFENPKFLKMFNTFMKEHVGNGYSLAIGDSGNTVMKGPANIKADTLRAFALLDPENELHKPYISQLAKNYYWLVGGDLENAYVDMFTDAADIRDRIEAVIDTEGEYEFISENLTGFGLALLRGGELVKTPGAIADKDTRYDTWMYYGRTDQPHSHFDMLQLAINAYGFNFMPDLGYPKATSFDESRWQWTSATLSHNTVVVDDDSQKGAWNGTPLHFDSTDKVKVIDVDSPKSYESTDIYRRTAITVEASNEVAYTVDFFRIKGGKSHTYSFHTQSYMGYTTDDLTLVPQVDENGEYEDTYAGHNITAQYIDPATGLNTEVKEVEYGGDPNGRNNTAAYKTMFPRGYTWLTNVNRAENIKSGNFSVNFAQTDFKHQVEDSSGLNMKFTALNDWTPTGIGIVTGYPPQTASNAEITGLDYMLIHRTSDKPLDTLFTSVLQPYKGEEYIADMVSVPLTSGGTTVSDNTAKAIRVSLKNGRHDYIVYSTNEGAKYTVTDTFKNAQGADITVSFDFSGFAGVYSVNDEGLNIYTYINDGTVIGNTSSVGSYNGEIVGFTDTLSSTNKITVDFDGDVDLARLCGEYIYIDNNTKHNGSYRILDAAPNAENSEYTDLNIGDVSLITSFKNDNDLDAGYNFNIAKYQKFSVPLTDTYDARPQITAGDLNNLTVTAGSSFTIDVNAQSDVSDSITFVGRTLPRGATVDAKTGVVTWKPGSSQVGEAGFVIAAIDGDGREATISFEVTVYGSTTSKPSGDSDNSGSTDSTDTPSGGGGGGGGGGGAAPAPDTDENTDVGEGVPALPSDDEAAQPGDGGNTDVPSKGFTDLGSHAWATDAINELAKAGIIKGTSETTFSPSANITRADFAILLVRAFDLSSDNTENFADVDVSDYFASELAVARNCGIVGGIGDNKYAPRNTITRQDMMVIVYRALTALGINVGEGLRALPSTDEVSYPDFDTVAEYAKEAVTFLISEGLVNGKNGLIAPTDYTTRAEVAVLIKRILDYIAE